MSRNAVEHYLAEIRKGRHVLLAACEDLEITDNEYDELRRAVKQYEELGEQGLLDGD